MVILTWVTFQNSTFYRQCDTSVNGGSTIFDKSMTEIALDLNCSKSHVSFQYELPIYIYVCGQPGCIPELSHTPKLYTNPCGDFFGNRSVTQYYILDGVTQICPKSYTNKPLIMKEACVFCSAMGWGTTAVIIITIVILFITFFNRWRIQRGVIKHIPNYNDAFQADVSDNEIELHNFRHEEKKLKGNKNKNEAKQKAKPSEANDDPFADSGGSGDDLIEGKNGENGKKDKNVLSQLIKESSRKLKEQMATGNE